MDGIGTPSHSAKTGTLPLDSLSGRLEDRPHPVRHDAAPDAPSDRATGPCDLIGERARRSGRTDSASEASAADDHEHRVVPLAAASSVFAHDVVSVTVQPSLTGLCRAGHGMPLARRVAACVPVGGRVAATGAAAGLTGAQMHPSPAHLHAFVALTLLRVDDFFDALDVSAGSLEIHRVPFSLSSLSVWSERLSHVKIDDRPLLRHIRRSACRRRLAGAAAATMPSSAAASAVTMPARKRRLSSVTSSFMKHYRSDLNAARRSVTRISGCSHAAKCPPLSALL